MNLQNVRWPLVLATMAVALAALFGGGFVLNNRVVEEPLHMLYTGSDVVASHTVEKQADGYLIQVTLKNTPDLAAAYQALNEQTQKILKGSPYTLKVQDNRTPQMTEALRRVDLHVQEGLATGKFAAMADQVEAEAAKRGLTAGVAVDGDYVYVQLHDAQDGYLYRVVKRSLEKEPAKRAAEGGFGL